VRALIDANVLVSAELARRDERSSLTRWIVFVALLAQRRFRFVTSEPLVRELHDVLVRRGFSRAVSDAYVAALSAEAEFVRIYGLPMGCPDPGDDKVLETALNGNVDVIVSRDAHLFDPRSRRPIEKTGIGIRDRPIRVVGVRTFVDELSGVPRFSPLVLPATLAA
jgi:predicted nucleic acid-binding protein